MEPMRSSIYPINLKTHKDNSHCVLIQGKLGQSQVTHKDMTSHNITLPIASHASTNY